MSTIPIITENLSLSQQRFAVNGELPRFWRMNRLEAYYWGWQYEDLAYKWTDHHGLDSDGKKVNVGMYKRRPKIIVDLPRAMVNAVVAFLFSRGRFPDLTVEGDNAQNWINLFKKKAKLEKVAKQVATLGNIVGSVFWTFQVINGKFSLKAYNGKVCYPQFEDDSGDELTSVLIRYKFKDANNEWRWFQKLYDKDRVVAFDQPKWVSEQVPNFQIVEENVHNLGFVPGTWVRNLDTDLPYFGGMYDGQGLYDSEGSLTHFDAINYLTSQFDRSLHFNLDPQMVFFGLSQADYERTLAKSPMTPWVLGKSTESDAKLLETTGNSYDKAEERLKTMVATVCKNQRVILMDPAELDIKADSSKAMERLFAPMLTLIDTERGNYGDEGLVPLLSKMLRAADILKSQGLKLQDDPGGVIEDDNVVLTWGDYFDRTPADMKADLDRAVTAMSSNLLSEESAVRYVASDFAIEDVQAEIEKINAEKASRVSSFSQGDEFTGGE